ncbi:MAG: hypothetical protein SWX82_19410 [Cyanobacteriota bacterium]|nr:hypothetical protein [Cyanobacteriota bacterium]
MKSPSKHGVADFRYDLYLLAITKLLNKKYLRLFNFNFHTLIHQRPKYLLLTAECRSPIAYLTPTIFE